MLEGFHVFGRISQKWLRIWKKSVLIQFAAANRGQHCTAAMWPIILVLILASWPHALTPIADWVSIFTYEHWPNAQTYNTALHRTDILTLFIVLTYELERCWQFLFDVPITLMMCPIFITTPNPSETKNLIFLNWKKGAWWLHSVKLFDWFIDSASPLIIGRLKWRIDLRELTVAV